jgi:hypothetical protein
MTTLNDLAGSRWAGQAELWLDRVGNAADLSDCTISVEGDAVRYTWAYEGKAHEGLLALRDGGADFSDSWHSPQAMAFAAVDASWALVDVMGTYPAPEGPPWGWRISLALRPTGELVLQMTNITPWGERGRAVRMVCTRA